MVGAAATGGVRMRLRVVERIETDDGRVLRAFEDGPEVEADLGWNAATAETVREALAAVVERGTGVAARVDGLRVGGKTGTAQNPHGADHAWFVAVAPVDSPAVAIAVLVEHGGGGAATAGPVARRVLERLEARERWTAPGGVRVARER
jgi:cell division protein FtsI/penicillin-binding protein 2